MKTLSEIRSEIDKVDDKLSQLLCDRAKLAHEVKEVKSKQDIRPYLPNREKEIIERVLPKCIEAGFSQKSIEEIFLSIISASRSIVGDFEVCFPGIRAGQSHAALIKQFGPIDNYRSMQNISLCIDNIEKDVSRYAVIPFSSFSTGIKTETLELLINRNIKIVSSVDLKEDFSIYSSETEISRLRKIYSTNIEGEKLGSLLSNFSSNIEIIFIRSEANLDSILIDAKQENSGIGILLASGFSVDLGLSELVPSLSLMSLEDNRYFIIEKGQAEFKKNSITSLVCAAKDSTGILKEIITPFSTNGITLKVIESRKPRSAVWECIFYLEADTSSVTANLDNIFGELKSICSYVKILGTPTI